MSEIKIEVNVFENILKSRDEQNKLLKAMSENKVDVVITEAKIIMRFSHPRDLLSYFVKKERE